MLIGLVKDSVLKCFCHTCSVNSAITGRNLHKKPLSKKSKKPRCKQPKRKRVYHATEIRCEEKSRGGMSYEMILADPITVKPEPSAVSPTTAKTPVTVEDINTRLQEAHDRRKSIEASKLATIAERFTKLEETNKKREDLNLAFIETSQAALEEKMDTTTSNRESHLLNLKSKVSEHLKNVSTVRTQLQSQSDDLRDAINLKLHSAQENRDEHINRMLEKLKEHEEYVQSIRVGHDESIRQLNEKIQSKLNLAEAKRISEQQKKLEQLKEKERRAEIVRANKEKLLAAEKKQEQKQEQEQ